MMIKEKKLMNLEKLLGISDIAPRCVHYKIISALLLKVP